MARGESRDEWEWGCEKIRALGASEVKSREGRCKRGMGMFMRDKVNKPWQPMEGKAGLELRWGRRD